MAILIGIDKTVTLPKKCKKNNCNGKESNLTKSQKGQYPMRYPLHHGCHVGESIKPDYVMRPNAYLPMGA